MYWHFGLRKAYQYIQVGMLSPPVTVKKKFTKGKEGNIL